MKNEADVIVVGAGPVGLLTAIELTLGGVRVLVLERLEAVNTVIKALSIGPLGSEALQRRGMAAAIADAEARSFAAVEQLTGQSAANSPGQASKFSGHFAGLPLIRKDVQREPRRQPRMVRQQDAESMLTDRALALGIEVHRGYEITGLVQRADGIDVDWVSPTDAGSVRCAFLVGCDGGRSGVRKLAGFAFPGTPPTMTMYQAIAEIDAPERLLPVGWRRTAGGVFSYGPFPGRLFMLDFSGPPANRQAPVTREEVEGVLRRVSGADVRIKSLEVANRWTDNTRLVDTYRRGRVLLAGDAAHVHSPFGGQGLSLGLVDAANLGWKLAAVVRGEMPEDLLDTYTAERRPAAEAVLANTLAQVAIMRPDPQAGAMRDLFAKLMELDEVNRSVGETMRGLSTRYDLGSEHGEVGRLVGDQSIENDESDTKAALYDLMQDGKGVFLDASPGGHASKLVAAATPRVRCVTVGAGPTRLIRPDACVAWVDEQGDTGGLEEALRRWFAPTLNRASFSSAKAA